MAALPREVISKKVKTGTVKDTRTFSEAATGFRMAFVHEDLEGTLPEEETGQIKTWILDRVDALSIWRFRPNSRSVATEGERC